MASDDKKSNQSVAKIMQLVEHLVQAPAPQKIQDIARAVSLPQATVLRYLRGLMLEGYIYQDDETGRYSPTWSFCCLGDYVREYRTLRTISSDLINTLSIQLKLGVSLVMEQNYECIFIDCVYDPKNMLRSLHRIGKSTPMHAGSSGKMLLSQHDENGVCNYVEQKGLARLTEKTICTAESLIQEIDRIRKQGYAIDDEESEEGIKCMAVALRDYSGDIVAALSVFGPVERMENSVLINEILPVLRDCGDKISFRMGYSSALRKIASSGSATQ